MLGIQWTRRRQLFLKRELSSERSVEADLVCLPTFRLPKKNNGEQHIAN